MVKEASVLISEFARQAGMSVDTVRFYIRRGLFEPDTNGKGGRNPYQVFTDQHLQQARMIRVAQSLGMSLKEIAAIGEEYRAGGLSAARSIEIMSEQLGRLRAKQAELAAMSAYLAAKLAWLKAGGEGPEPDFGAYVPDAPSVRCG